MTLQVNDKGELVRFNFKKANLRTKLRIVYLLLKDTLATQVSFYLFVLDGILFLLSNYITHTFQVWFIFMTLGFGLVYVVTYIIVFIALHYE